MDATTWSVARVGRGRTQLRTTGDNGRNSATIDIDLTQDEVRHLVKQLCQKAGLPEPWKKG